jgi:hypothetical protein
MRARLSAVVAGIGIVVLLGPAGRPSQTRSLHRDAFVMDGHIHVMTRQLLQGGDIGQQYPDGHVDLPRARAGGLDAMFFPVYTPEAYYPARYAPRDEQDAVIEFLNSLRILPPGTRSLVADGHARPHESSRR